MGRPGSGLARATLLGFAATLSACTRTELSMQPARVTQPARHVLLVVVDTLRADRVGAFGGAADASPCMDGLARRGVRFERASAQSSWTSPSMVSLFTGRYLAERRLSLPAEARTIAEHFRANGFATAAFVTNPLVSAQNGFARGFDEFHVLPRPHGDPRIGAWLRAQAGRPTFTFVHLSEPHDPYTPPERMRKRERVPLEEDVLQAVTEEAARHGLGNVSQGISEIEEQLALYEGEVRWSDRALADMLIALDEAGELEQACVALTSDHGEGLWTRPDLEAFYAQRLEQGEPLSLAMLFKQRHGGQLHQELIRVPLVVAAPGLPRRGTVDVLVENVDLLPTLLELAGLARPSGLDGESLLTAVQDPGAWPKREAFSMTRYARSLTTADGLKLIEPTRFGTQHAGMETELYDLRADPRERRNLAGERPEVVRALGARIATIAARGFGAADPHAQAEVERNFEALRALGYFGAQGESEAPIGADDE